MKSERGKSSDHLHDQQPIILKSEGQAESACIFEGGVCLADCLFADDFSPSMARSPHLVEIARVSLEENGEADLKCCRRIMALETIKVGRK